MLITYHLLFGPCTMLELKERAKKQFDFHFHNDTLKHELRLLETRASRAVIEQKGTHKSQFRVIYPENIFLGIHNIIALTLQKNQNHAKLAEILLFVEGLWEKAQKGR